MQLPLALLTVFLPAFTAAHGYLCKPPPRGIEKEAYNVDALKSPNFGGKVCRGEGPGQITTVEPGASITLEFKITAPHTGPCKVYLLDLDLDLSKQVEIGDKYDCAAPGKVAPWTIQLPDGVQGRKVLRWYWEGRHVSPGEPYEQCVDLQIGSGSAPRGGLHIIKSMARPRPSQPAQAPAPVYQQEQPYGEAEPEVAPMAYDENTESADDDSDSAYQEGDEESDYGSETTDADSNGDEASDYGSETTDVDSTGDESAYGQGGCKNGQYVCNDDGSFSICSQNSLIRQACGAGQVCVPSNGSILCVLASQAGNY